MFLDPAAATLYIYYISQNRGHLYFVIACKDYYIGLSSMCRSPNYFEFVAVDKHNITVIRDLMHHLLKWIINRKLSRTRSKCDDRLLYAADKLYLHLKV